MTRKRLRSLRTLGLRRAATAFLAILVMLGFATSTSNVAAQSVEGLREKAAKVAAELDTLQEESGRLNEEYLQTQEDISGYENEQRAHRQAVEEAQARLDQSRQQATGFLVEAYVGAGMHNQVAFGQANPNEAVNQQVLLELLQGDSVQLADSITADQQDLAVKTLQLKNSVAQLEARKSKQAKVVSQLDRSVSRQQQLLDSTKGELRVAVEAEQQRAAAQAQRSAAQEQRAAAQEQPTSAQASTPAANPSGRAARPGPTVAAAPANSPSRPSAAAVAAQPSQNPLPVSAPNPAAAAAIAAARTQLGTPYRYGGSAPGGFDCSGLLMWSWARAGVSLPRTSGAQRGATQRITRDQLQPGDLVFYRSPVGHAGMYIGGGQMIHSPHTGDVVKISAVDRMGGSVSYGRVG